MNVTADEVDFCDDKSTKAVHQQHVNRLINTWVLPVKIWLLIACDTAFYAVIIYALSVNFAITRRRAWDITPCNKHNKSLVVYRFSYNVFYYIA